MAGTNNEAQHIFRSQVFHIRSEDGRNYQLDQFGNEVLTGFTIDPFKAIECNHNQSFLVSLASMEFPYSFYTTDLTNNQINVKTQTARCCTPPHTPSSYPSATTTPAASNPR